MQQVIFAGLQAMAGSIFGVAVMAGVMYLYWNGFNGKNTNK